MVTTAPAEIRCYRCGSEPAGQCPQCRRPYCRDHGNRLCLDCRRAGGSVEVRIPLQGLPSSWLYRGVMLAMVAGVTLIAWDTYQWLLRGGPAAQQPDQLNPPAIVATAQPSPATPANAGPIPTAVGERTHTVAPGDTLFGIALQYNVSVDSIIDLNKPLDPEVLRVGQVLKIPLK